MRLLLTNGGRWCLITKKELWPARSDCVYDVLVYDNANMIIKNKSAYKRKLKRLLGLTLI